jgi:hypothetical protein
MVNLNDAAKGLKMVTQPTAQDRGQWRALLKNVP